MTKLYINISLAILAIFNVVMFGILSTAVDELHRTPVVVISDITPNCPTEDSCSIDYRDGRWVITPIIP